MFGDLAAGLLLEIGKWKVANLRDKIDPLAASQLKEYFYVDKGILGGTEADVQWMRGSRIDGNYTGMTAKILVLGKMSIKFVAVLGYSDKYEKEQLGGKNLGVSYAIMEDQIVMSIYYNGKSNASDKLRELVELSRADVSELLTGRRKLTRCNALSMVMGVYDPLGLISPALVRGKVMLRCLYTGDPSSGWDADILPLKKRKWATWFEELLLPVETQFPCSTKPKTAVGLPRLAGFCNAADEAVCALLYVVWDSSEEQLTSRLLLAKC